MCVIYRYGGDGILFRNMTTNLQELYGPPSYTTITKITDIHRTIYIYICIDRNINTPLTVASTLSFLLSVKSSVVHFWA